MGGAILKLLRRLRQPRRSLKRWFRRLRIKSVRKLTSGELGRSALLDSGNLGSLALVETHEGIFFVTNSRDTVVGRQTFIEQRAYDAEKLRIALETLGEKGVETLINVGGNIGTVAITSVMLGYANKAVVFEPEPTNFSLLKINMALNRCEDLVEAYQIALGNGESSALDLVLNPSNLGDHRIMDSTQKSGGSGEISAIRVPADVLDTYLAKVSKSSCLVFMDVQGYEGQVLEGASKFLENAIPLVIEYDLHLLEEHDGLAAVQAMILGNPYRFISDLGNQGKVVPSTLESFTRIKRELKNGLGYTDLLFF